MKKGYLKFTECQEGFYGSPTTFFPPYVLLTHTKIVNFILDSVEDF